MGRSVVTQRKISRLEPLLENEYLKTTTVKIFILLTRFYIMAEEAEINQMLSMCTKMPCVYIIYHFLSVFMLDEYSISSELKHTSIHSYFNY